MMLVRTSEHLNFPVVSSAFIYRRQTKKREELEKEILDATGTRDKNAYFAFTLELMLSLTTAIYQHWMLEMWVTEREGNKK